MTTDHLLDALYKLLPTQLDDLVYRLRVPAHLISGSQTPVSTRAIELLRWADLARTFPLAIPRPASYPHSMSTVVIEVLYENGVFRPVEPISLPEGSRAKVIATTPPAPPAIVQTPGVCGGRACIAGTRITVWGIVEHRRLGLADDLILQAIPTLRPDQLAAALLYADEHPEEIARDLAENQE